MIRGKRNRSIVIYATVTLFTLAFGQIYEYFGFGVTSPFMHFAFLIPLLLGLLPCVLMRVSGRADVFSETPKAWWRLGIATLMAGSVFRGVLDIYGTESPLLYCYPAAGIVCLAVPLFLAARGLTLRDTGAEEIATIFLAMATGLATGMGYLGIAVLFAVVVSVLNMILVNSKFGEQGEAERSVKITIPEDMDFEGIFDDLLEKYTKKAVMMEAKTAGMGSLYKLDYKVEFRRGVSVRAFLDEIRERNGNLEVSCGRPAIRYDEL